MLDCSNLCELLDYIEKEVDNERFLNYLEGETWQSISSDEFIHKVRALASAFQKHGVSQGECVAIVSESSPFWLIVDYALQSLGAVSVPIFANISSENLSYELEDAKIAYVFIATQEKYDQVEEALSSMKLVLIKDIKAKGSNIVEWDSFTNADETFEKPFIKEDDLATIIYTSGSTGLPKGVELSHKNLITQIKDTHACFSTEPGFKVLSFLPLAHIFERMVMSFYLSSGVSVYFADDVKNVGNLLKEVQPHIMTVVPRLLDKIYTKMHENANAARGFKWLIAKLAFERADHKDPNTSSSNPFDRLFHKLVYSKLVDALGGNLKYLITGGAPLSMPVYTFFHNVGIPLYQGYGLTETSPVICVNTPRSHKVGSCGKPFEHVTVKLASDGELLMQGDSMMLGYHNHPKKTKKTIDEQGWLHTGDLAKIDDEGYIYILSRKKELFKTSTGKYVSAIAIEQKITANKWIDYALIIADNRPFVTALIFMDEILLEEFAKRKKISSKDIQDIIEHRRIQAIVMNLIKKVNLKLNHWEQIQKFYIVPESLSIENGTLTPSMKIARKKVEELYSNEIENFYGREL